MKTKIEKVPERLKAIFGLLQVKFGETVHKTNVVPKTLCPTWNADFRFEFEDGEVQDDVLEIKWAAPPCSRHALKPSAAV